MQFDIKDYADFKIAVDTFCSFLSNHSVSEEKVFDSKLIVHELIGNVLQHSGGSAFLRVEIEDGSIHIAVRAEKVFQPPEKGARPSTNAERGRGIFLVDELSERRTFTKNGEILVRIQCDK